MKVEEVMYSKKAFFKKNTYEEKTSIPFYVGP
jgi:hypothetical protein